MTFSRLFVACLPAFLISSLFVSSRPGFASDDCPTSSSAPQDKIAVAFGYAIYSDIVRGSTIDGAGAKLCLDSSGNVISPPDPPLICSLAKGSDDPSLSYDASSGSLLANVNDLAFVTTNASASVLFEVTALESPNGSNFVIKTADYSSDDDGYLELSSGIPLMIARSNDGNIPFTAEFTNGHLSGEYRAVVTVTCNF